MRESDARSGPASTAEDQRNAAWMADEITTTVTGMRPAAQERTATTLANGIAAGSLDTLTRAVSALHADFTAHTRTLGQLKAHPRQNWLTRLFISRESQASTLQAQGERLEGALVIIRQAIRVRSSDLADAQQGVARDITILEALTKSDNAHVAAAAHARLADVGRAYYASQTNDTSAINWWQENIDSLLRSAREARATGEVLNALNGVEKVLHERDRQFGEKKRTP